jgi:hypothetical protein
MEDVGIFYVNLVNFPANLEYIFMAIWYNFPSFGIFFPVLVCYTKKNLATQKWISKGYSIHFSNGHCLMEETIL